MALPASSPKGHGSASVSKKAPQPTRSSGFGIRGGGKRSASDPKGQGNTK